MKNNVNKIIASSSVCKETKSPLTTDPIKNVTTCAISLYQEHQENALLQLHEIPDSDPEDVEISGTIETDEKDDDLITEEEKNAIARLKLKSWAISSNINALKKLITIWNERIPSINLPQDPRTFLSTMRTVDMVPLGNGYYWHHGLENCLIKLLRNDASRTNLFQHKHRRLAGVQKF